MSKRRRPEETEIKPAPSAAEYRVIADEELKKAGTKVIQDLMLIQRAQQFTRDIETHIMYDSPMEGVNKLRDKMMRIQAYLSVSAIPWLRAKSDRKAGQAVGAWQRLFAMTKVLVHEIEGYIGEDRREEDGTLISNPSATETRRWEAINSAAKILEDADVKYKEETGRALYSQQLREIVSSGEREYDSYKVDPFVSTPFISREDLVETVIMFVEQEIFSCAHTLSGVAWADEDVSSQQTIVLHSSGAGQLATSSAPARIEASMAGLSSNLAEQIEELNSQLKRMREGSND